MAPGSSLGRISARLGRRLRSPWLAAALLGAFVLACLLGNAVPQLATAGQLTVAAWEKAHPTLAVFVRAVDGFRTFQTPWFLILCTLLALNTLACTLDQVARAWQISHRSVEVPGAVLPTSAGEIVWRQSPEQARTTAAQTLRRLGLRPRPAPEGWYASSTLGRWGSPLFHLGLVLLFLAVVGGALLRWSVAVVLPEGGVYEPAEQAQHGEVPSLIGWQPAPASLPRIELVSHSPRYQWKSYVPDAASQLRVNGKRQLVRMGAPLSLGLFSLHQVRRYGVLAEVVLRPAGAEGAKPAGTKPAAGGAASPPPPFGGPVPTPDGAYQAGIVFVQQDNPEQQRRELFLGPAGATAAFRLLPGPLGTHYELPVGQRFQLAVSLVPAGGANAQSERLLSQGQSMAVGNWTLEFRSLRYWTTFVLSASPLTPLFFLLAWWCALALGLGVLLPERHVRLVFEPADAPDGESAGSGTRVRYHAVGGRGAADFPERLAEALRGAEEGQP